MSATSSLECGSDWNRHITYIMIDFLSGFGVFTSATDTRVTRTAGGQRGGGVEGVEGRTFRVEQAVDAEVVVRQLEGVVQARARRPRHHAGVVEQLRPPAVQQRVEGQPVRPRRREVLHVHARIILRTDSGTLVTSSRN